jgi:hypothetical protein
MLNLTGFVVDGAAHHDYHVGFAPTLASGRIEPCIKNVLPAQETMAGVHKPARRGPACLNRPGWPFNWISAATIMLRFS